VSSNVSDFTVTQYKANPGQVNVNEAQGIVECFVAALGNKDSVGDICLPGCFSSSLKRRKPRVVWGHNWNEPIGKVLEIYEVGPNDPRLPSKMRAKNVGGLFAKVQFNLMSEKGREAFSNVAFFGEEQEWSIGYKTLDAVFDTTQQANLLKEVELYEVSPVLHGANQLTATLSIKSDEQKAEDSSPCWPGYKQLGMKPGKNGKMVPNCVPVDGNKKSTDEGMEQKFHGGVLYAPAETAQNPVTGRMGALARHINMHFGGEVVIRSAEENIVIFDLTRDGTTETLRSSYHSPNGVDFMFGAAQAVRAEVVYMPVNGSTGSRVAGDDDGHGGCGCGGACGGTKSDCGCGGECGGCGVKDAFPSWEDFKQNNPGIHLFIKTANGDIYDAAQEVANYHGFTLELLSDGFAVPNIDWYGTEAPNALVSVCEAIDKKAAPRPSRVGRGMASSARGVRLAPAKYDGDNDGFKTGPTGLDNIPYVRPPNVQKPTPFKPMNPEREEPKEVPEEIPESEPIRKPKPQRVPTPAPAPAPAPSPTPTPEKEPEKEPEKPGIPEKPRIPARPVPQRQPARTGNKRKSANFDAFISVSEYKDMQIKSGLHFNTSEIDSVVINVPVADIFEFKSLIDPVLEYHHITALAVNSGVQIFRYSQLTDEAISALSSVIKNF